jgi:hypothetical protein
MAVIEIVSPPAGVLDPSQVDDAAFRGAGAALIAAPFLYIAGVPVCFAVGRLLTSFGLLHLGKFLGGTIAVALCLGVLVGALLSFPSSYGLGDVALSMSVASFLFIISALPAACCWWLFAVRPHNTPLNRKRGNSRAPVS